MTEQQNPLSPTPPSHFGLKAMGFILAGVVMFTIIAWLTAKFTTPYVQSVQTVVNDRSIAVLPFAVVGGELVNDTVAMAVTNELSIEVRRGLAQRSSLETSTAEVSNVFRSSATLNVKQVGAALGVVHLLQGSVTRRDADLSVTVTLTDIRNNAEAWSGAFVVDQSSIRTVADSIVQLLTQRVVR